MATYPDTKIIFDTVENGIDTVQASHVNVGYAEIEAIEGILGTNPSTRSGPWSATPLVVSSTTFATTKLRLDNVENGAYYAQESLVNKAGGTTINPSGDAVKGLVIKARSGQTAKLLEFQLSDATVVSYFDNNGTFYTPTIDGGSA